MIVKLTGFLLPKALTEDPSDNIEKNKIGEVYRYSYKNNGLRLFYKNEDGVEGLIHNSELDWTNKNINLVKSFSITKN